MLGIYQTRLAIEVEAENAMAAFAESMGKRLSEEDGEIGSSLIFMIVMIGAAIAIEATLNDGLKGIAEKIRDSLTDA